MSEPTKDQEERLELLRAEASEVEMAMKHLQAAVKAHRKQCTPGERGCGLERRLLATFDHVLQMKHEYTATAMEILGEGLVSQ